MTQTRPRRSIVAIIALVSGLLLAGCSAPGSTPKSLDTPDAQSQFLAANGLEGLDVTGIIELLDQQPLADRPTDLMASVRPNELVLSNAAGQEMQLDMPVGQVYVSVAPFQEQTHDCHFHSLTTCTGELANAEIEVSVVESNGTVLVDDILRTYDNGFIGFWVPAGIEATVTVMYEGREGSAAISTVNPDDPTCVTTLQLA